MTERNIRPPIERRHGDFGVFRAACDAAPIGVVVTDEAGTILFANPLASSMLAFTPSELVGMHISTLVPETSGSGHAGHWAEFWKNPENRKMAPDQTLVARRKDGVMVPVEIGLTVFDDAERRCVIASVRDVTERLNLETRLSDVTHEHVGFHKLVADIAARIGGASAEALDDAILDAMRRLGEALHLDQATLWHRRVGETDVKPISSWRKDTEVIPAPEPYAIDSIPYVISKLEAGEACWFTTPDDLPDPVDRETFQRHGQFRSALVVPLPSMEPSEGDLRALALRSTNPFTWTQEIIERLRLVAGVIGQALSRAASQTALTKALEEVKQLRDRVTAENAELRREVRGLRPPTILVTDGPAMTRIVEQINQVAPTPATVLLLGETGTGKEVIAQAIHALSPRHQRPMIKVSCAAIPSALIESELFGRERGAYTGALSRQIGRFEAANQSTLFLDEIGDLPPDVQVKLLRVLQERVIERLGSTQSVKVDVRIIAATNRNLEEAVEQKTFREDLYYRLYVFPLVVPPLRERLEDIPGLVWSFVDEFSRMFGKTITSISKETMAELQRHSWPGNVRELRNVIERAVIISTAKQLVVQLPRSPVRVPQAALTLTELETEHIRSVLNSTNWRVRGRGGAAERLGLKPTTLESRMARLGITRTPGT